MEETETVQIYAPRHQSDRVDRYLVSVVDPGTRWTCVSVADAADGQTYAEGMVLDVSVRADPRRDPTHRSSYVVARFLEGAGTALYVARVVVPVERRDHGIGGRAVRMLMDEGRRLGARRAYLFAGSQAGRDDDLARFYARLGFRPLGVRDVSTGGIPMGASI